jgi:hypothetical protein
MILKRYLLLLVFGAASLCSAGRPPVPEIQTGGQQSDQKSNGPKKEPSPKLGTRDSTRERAVGGSAGKDGNAGDNSSNTAVSAHTTLPSGVEIKVRTDTSIPAKPAADSRYSASVSEDVKDSSGNVVIPRGSRARLVAVPSNDGKDTNLDLRSVTITGTAYLLEAIGKSNNGAPEGVGANKRTGKYVGGGAAVGALLGALMGGGKGAAIGAVLGGGAGAGTQVLTGKKQDLPAETQLSYKLAQNLQLTPATNKTGGTSQK